MAFKCGIVRVQIYEVILSILRDAFMEKMPKLKPQLSPRRYLIMYSYLPDLINFGCQKGMGHLPRATNLGQKVELIPPHRRSGNGPSPLGSNTPSLSRAVKGVKFIWPDSIIKELLEKVHYYECRSLYAF
jgi:hypothetical protein